MYFKYIIYLYKNATYPLQEPFVGQAENLRAFLDKVADRATAFGWNNVLDIKITPSDVCDGIVTAARNSRDVHC
jgi:hypothetical protein